MGLNQNRLITTVTPTFPALVYCDPGDIQRRISILGVKSRTQDYGEVGGEFGVLEDVILDATETINFYCFSHYRPEDLVTSSWINRRATDIALYLLEMRRGNTPTGPIASTFKLALDWLEKINTSLIEVPGIPVRATQAPAWSNVRINQLYPTFRIRVERTISEKTPAPYNQQIDWSAEFDYSI